ncbi:NACHT and WD domain-containing protein [Apiospora marii]
MTNERPRPQPPAYAAGKLLCLTKQAVEAPTFDLVAVHGLQVSTYKPDTWLTHLLPKRFPGSRVLLFRYNTQDVFAAPWEAGFEQSVSKLLNGIVAARDPLPAQRPLVFLCQGLGGLLVEAALNRVMADDPRYQQLKTATKAVILLNTPQNQTNMAPWTSSLIQMAAPSLHTEPLLLMDVEKWLQGNASSLQQVALLFKERCSKLRVLSVYNSVSAVQLGSGDELSKVFATGFKREKTLDIKGYDYHSAPKPANENDELLLLLAKEVKLQLRSANLEGPLDPHPDSRPASNAVGSKGRDKQVVANADKANTPSAQGQQTSIRPRPLGTGSSTAPGQTRPGVKKTDVADRKRGELPTCVITDIRANPLLEGVLGSQPDSKPAVPNIGAAPRSREGPMINNKVTQIVSVQNQQTSLQKQQFGPGYSMAPNQTGPVPQNGASSKPPNDRPQPNSRPASNAPGPIRPGQANREVLPGNNPARPTQAYNPQQIPGSQPAYPPPQANGMTNQISVTLGNSMYTGPPTQQPASQRSGPSPRPPQNYLPYLPPSGQPTSGNVAGSGRGQGYPGGAQQAAPNKGFNGQAQRQQKHTQQKISDPGPKNSGFLRGLFGSGTTPAGKQQATRGMPLCGLGQAPAPSRHHPTRSMPPNPPSQPQLGQQQQQQQQLSNSAYWGNSQSSRDMTPQYGQNNNTPSSGGPPSAAPAGAAMQPFSSQSSQQPSQQINYYGAPYPQSGHPGSNDRAMQPFSPQGHPQAGYQPSNPGAAYAQPQQQPVAGGGSYAQRGFFGNNVHHSPHHHEEHHDSSHYHRQDSTRDVSSSSTKDNTKDNLKAAGGGFAAGLALGAGGMALYDHFHDKDEDKAKQDQQDQQGHVLDGPHEECNSSDASGSSEDDEEYSYQVHDSENGDEEEEEAQEQHRILGGPYYDDSEPEAFDDGDDGNEETQQGYDSDESEEKGEEEQEYTLGGFYNEDTELEAFYQREEENEYPYYSDDSEEENPSEQTDPDAEDPDGVYSDDPDDVYSNDPDTEDPDEVSSDEEDEIDPDEEDEIDPDEEDPEEDYLDEVYSENPDEEDPDEVGTDEEEPDEVYSDDPDAEYPDEEDPNEVDEVDEVDEDEPSSEGEGLGYNSDGDMETQEDYDDQDAEPDYEDVHGYNEDEYYGSDY